MWLRNCWQVIAFGNEIGRTPLARTVCGEEIVMFRTTAGEAVALADRCPHRLAPLSLGRLVGDEIQCGYGRTGTFLAHEQAGIVPDLLTVAKPMAGGLPMGAILATKEIADTMQPGDHGTTFGGGPFLSHVALHVLERLSDPAMLAHVKSNGAWIRKALQKMAAARPSKIRAVRGIGYMWGIDIAEPSKDVVARALEAGLLICSAGEHTLRLLPPLVTSHADLERGLGILATVIG